MACRSYSVPVIIWTSEAPAFDSTLAEAQIIVAIYGKPVRVLLQAMIKDLASQKGQRFSREQAIKWFGEHYPDIKEGTISAHLIRFSTNVRSRLHYTPKSGEDLLFKIDQSHFRLYDPTTDPVPIHPTDPPGQEGEPIPAQASSEFAYESDLRDFLAKNASVIEPGLQLYKDEEEGITGIEYPVGNRFIDILAVDDKNRLVVIELKVSRGYDRTVGQLLGYMARIRKNLAEPDQAVRGIIAARKISDDLRLACSGLPSVSLYEYELSVTLRKVPSGDLNA